MSAADILCPVDLKTDRTFYLLRETGSIERHNSNPVSKIGVKRTHLGFMCISHKKGKMQFVRRGTVADDVSVGTL